MDNSESFEHYRNYKSAAQKFAEARRVAGIGIARKSKLDMKHIPTGNYGQRVKGINILEQNRATEFASSIAGVTQLAEYLQSNFRSKGVNAVLFGIEYFTGPRYAVFVQDGFLQEVSEDE